MYLLLIVSGVIGFIGSIVSIWAELGYGGLIVSIGIAIIIFILGYKYFLKPTHDNITPSKVEIITQGDQSPGIVAGNFKVNMHERPRNKN